MAQTNSSLQRWEPIVLSILRIVIGLLILEHGMQKLFHLPPPDHPMGGPGGLPPLMMVAAGSTISACQHWKARFHFLLHPSAFILFFVLRLPLHGLRRWGALERGCNVERMTHWLAISASDDIDSVRQLIEC